jgi:XTP/dITP diphosphohydrolase
VAVTLVEPDPEALVRALAAHDSIVWLAGPAGDEDFARRLGMRLAREPALAELELMYGSWDPPGARLLDAVAVMDRLVSPAGTRGSSSRPTPAWRRTCSRELRGVRRDRRR